MSSKASKSKAPRRPRGVHRTKHSLPTRQERARRARSAQALGELHAAIALVIVTRACVEVLESEQPGWLSARHVSVALRNACEALGKAYERVDRALLAGGAP